MKKKIDDTGYTTLREIKKESMHKYTHTEM